MPRRRGVYALLVLALAAAASGDLDAQEPGRQAATRGRRLAAAGDNTRCPRAALYIIPALPNVRDAATFQLLRATYVDTVKRLAPAGAISDVIPTLTEPNKQKGGILVHTTVLFSGSCEAGKAAARALHVKLLGDVRTLFYVPAPRAKSLFGDVYMVTAGFPYLADGSGAKLVEPTAPAGTNLAAQFSIVWEDIPPSKIGELQAAAFKAAILKQLPAGAGVYFTTMITEGVSYRFGNHWRASAAPISPTVARSAGQTSQGGVVWPPGQPADVKSGRLVFNTNVHGTAFNTAAGKATLTKFLATLRSSPAAVFPPHTFGRMALEPGYGLRLVNDPAYPCTCEIAHVPPPTVTLAQAYGPTSATATASGAANITWASWLFTASSASGAAISQEADSPLVWWYNLAANTRYTISVVGITQSGKRVPGANTLAIRTPQEGSPTVAAANPTSATQASVRLTPPTNNRVVSLYMVALCLKAQPSSCVRQNSTSIQLSFSSLAPGASYVVSATALIGGKPVPASNTLPLVMPQRGAPILLTAAASSALTGTATAAAPNGTAFSQFVFTALSPSGAPNATSTVTNPLNGRFTGLRPATQYKVTVRGYSGATPSSPSNTLSFVTSPANAPLNTGTPKSPFLIVVSVVPPLLAPLKGGTWVKFDVTLCPIAGPLSACVTKRTGGNRRRLLGASESVTFQANPSTTYNSVSTAISESGEQSKQSMTDQVTTPGILPPPPLPPPRLPPPSPSPPRPSPPPVQPTVRSPPPSPFPSPPPRPSPPPPSPAPPPPSPRPPPPSPSPPPPSPSPPPPSPSPPPPSPSPPPPSPSPPPPSPSPPPPSPAPPPPSPSPPPPSPSPPPPSAVTGQAAFTTPGTYTWTAPAGVSAVSVVCIGGGGGASLKSGKYTAGGAGGGLGWANNIAVTAGTGYTVVVGAGGGLAAAGGDSYFISTTTVMGGGGGAGNTVSGATGGGFYPAAQGGKGGDAQAISATVACSSAGGGAGGYAGNGGKGGGPFSPTGGASNSGAGGGGDVDGGNGITASSGGGVGLLGKGATGSAGSFTSPPGGGKGGSGGVNGANGNCATTATCGGSYGGGGGMGKGAGGACRIIWGPGRAYPSTGTADV